MCKKAEKAQLMNLLIAGMVPVWIVAVLAAIVLFCAFLFASFLGL